MNHDIDETLARHDQHTAGGLALLPDDLQIALQGTTDDFRRVLGSALFDIHDSADRSDYARGIDFGRALGILAAGAALNQISHPQLDALMAALKQVKPQ